MDGVQLAAELDPPVGAAVVAGLDDPALGDGRLRDVFGEGRGDVLDRALCREIEAARPYFVEDPLRSENPDSYRMLRARTGVPLAAGEQFGSKSEFRQLIEEELIDYTRLDVGVVAGLTEAKKIAAMAETHCIRLATHNPLGPVTAASSLQLNLTCPNVAVQEHQAEPEAVVAGLFTVRPTVLPGRIERNAVPGIGVDIDRKEARRYQAVADERPHLRTADGAFINW
ncbi:enolase C-terminal domain-like protein [Streptomyces colonosanans]|uniref:Enolase C-terminal domain-containing protein n=1 Tax=Streptomyces colonosanans TaxID=1428652 RepID=A0A1S2Q1I8_9ACTN|nr:enolase C-terminal domain-like protein [Streptomyces colonosanans]OIJ99616.1 hypothetical protein BIV24_04600 [Streptomyces colonosanans]